DFSEEAIGDQTDATLAAAHHYDVLSPCARSGQTIEWSETDAGNRNAVDIDDGGRGAGARGLRRYGQALLHGLQGNDEALSASLHGQPGEDGQGQWQADGEGRSSSGHAGEIDAAAKGA